MRRFLRTSSRGRPFSTSSTSSPHNAPTTAPHSHPPPPPMLHSAIAQGKLAPVKFLVERGDGIDINAKDSHGLTALHVSIASKTTPITDFLLSQASINVNELEENKQTPLHLACFLGDLEIVQKLVGRGANVNSNDGLNGTPLHMACHKGHAKVAEFLIGHGAKLDICSNEDGSTPLHIASSEGLHIPLTPSFSTQTIFSLINQLMQFLNHRTP
jgi:hypothetical protein